MKADLEQVKTTQMLAKEW